MHKFYVRQPGGWRYRISATVENIPNYYDALAPQYDASRFNNSYGQFLHAQEYQVLGTMLKGVSPAHTLDMACGTGRFLRFADTGLDLSPNMTEEARKKHPEKNILTGDATRLPFADASFDAVFSFHLIMHLDPAQTRAVLAEAHRVLRPGGRFIFDFPSQKRRRLTGGHHGANWHGSNAMRLSDCKRETACGWNIIDYQGILFLPVHRFPAWFRRPLLPFDNFCCRSLWREWASYLVLNLLKK